MPPPQSVPTTTKYFFSKIYRIFRARPLFYIALMHAAVVAIFFHNKEVKIPAAIRTDAAPQDSIVEGKIITWPAPASKNRLRFTIETPDKSRILVISGEPSSEKIRESLIPGAVIILENGRFIAPQNPRNPDEFDYKKYLASKKISLLFYQNSDEGKIRILLEAPPLNKLYRTIRSYIISTVRRYVSDENFSSGILIQMLVGEVDESAKTDVQPYFSATGVAHVLVISGLHVGYIIGIFWTAFRITGLNARFAAGCALPFVWAYSVIAGGTPPVVRATIMATVMIGGLLINRGYDSYQALGLSSLIILGLNPREVFSAGFQLSFGATFGIIHILKNMPLPHSVKKLPLGIGNITGILWMSAAAQVFTAPVIAGYFGFLSAVSFPANLIVVPSAGIALTLGLLLSAAAVVSSAIATFVGNIASLLLKFMFISVRYMAEIPGSKIFTPTPDTPFLFAYYTAVISIPILVKNKKRRAALATGILFLAVIVALKVISDIKKPLVEVFIPDTKESGAEFSYIKIKKGPSIIVNAGAPYTTGENPASKIYLPFLRRKGVRFIDAVFITSPELTRYGAIEEILKEIPTKIVYTNPEISMWPEYISLMEKLESMKIPVETLWAPSEITLNRNISVKVLNPSWLYSGRGRYPSRNALAFIMRIEPDKMRDDNNRPIHLYFSDSVRHYAIIEPDKIPAGAPPQQKVNTLPDNRDNFSYIVKRKNVLIPADGKTTGAVTVKIYPDGKIVTERFANPR